MKTNQSPAQPDKATARPIASLIESLNTFESTPGVVRGQKGARS